MWRRRPRAGSRAPARSGGAASVGHRRQRVDADPSRVDRLVVGDHRLARDPRAAEAQAEERRAVAVGELDHRCRVRPDQPVRAGDDAGLLEDLAHRPDGRLLDRVEDPRHDGPREVVGALDEQHLVGPVDRARADHDGGDAGEPEQVRSHVLAQPGDELGDRHPPRVRGPAGAAGMPPDLHSLTDQLPTEGVGPVPAVTVPDTSVLPRVAAPGLAAVARPVVQRDRRARAASRARASPSAGPSPAST